MKNEQRPASHRRSEPRCRRLALVLVVPCLLVASRAWAQRCTTPTSPAVLSEARAARWLVSDDVHANALLDAHRGHVTAITAQHGVRQPAVEVFSSGSFGYQGAYGFPVCASTGDATARMERLRVLAAAGVSHTATRLSLRVSFVHAQDQLAVDVQKPGAEPDSDGDIESEDATAGYRQQLVAVRVGHDRWGRALLGYIGNELTFNSPAYGLSLNPRLASGGSPGFFYGVSIPAIHASVVAVAQRGTPELVQVTAYDLEPPGLPLSLAVGPTYIREERQIVGLFRLRSRAAGHAHNPNRAVEVDEDDIATHGTGSSSARVSPMIELSTESSDARLRHGRFRVDAHYEHAFVPEHHGSHTMLRVAAGAEGTVFRSRFFSESFAVNGGEPRSSAWGVGGGLLFDLDFRWVSFGLDAHAGLNRPELLSLMPSAADRAELRLLATLRVEN